jgi:acyl carrier protein
VDPTSGLDISGGRDKIGEIYHNRARRIFMSDTFGDVKEIIIDLLGVPEEKVTPEAKFREDLEADSLDLVELIMAFEDKFGGRFPMKTHRQLLQSVRRSSTSTTTCVDEHLTRLSE